MLQQSRPGRVPQHEREVDQPDQTGVGVLERVHGELKTQMDGGKDEGGGIVRLEWYGLAPKGRGVEAEGARFAADPVTANDLGVQVE